MNLNDDISRRIEMLRFPLIVGVVFIHTLGSTVTYTGEAVGVVELPFLPLFIQALVSNVISRVVIPIFFMISGFLFFKEFSPRAAVYRKKLHKRVRTLFVPYFLWNLLTMIFFLIIVSLPWFTSFFTGRLTNIKNFGAYDFLNAFLAFDGYPISYQFWFIRDLIVIILLSPIIWLIARYIPRIGLLIFMGIWLLSPPNLKYLNLSYVGVFFFLLGAVIMVREWKLDWLDRYGKYFVIAYIPASLFAATLLTIGVGHRSLWASLTFFLAIPAFWFLAGKACNCTRVSSLLLAVSSFSFFVYATHEPMLTIIRKLTFRLLTPTTSLEIIFLYFTLPIVVIGMTLTAAFIMKKLTPYAYKIVTGSR